MGNNNLAIVAGVSAARVGEKCWVLGRWRGLLFSMNRERASVCSFDWFRECLASQVSLYEVLCPRLNEPTGGTRSGLLWSLLSEKPLALPSRRK